MDAVDTADVLIIGGGIIGLSIAYHLARAGGSGGRACRIVVFERASQVGTGSTAKATGGIRHQFSTEVNVRLTQLSLPAFSRFEEEMGEPVDLVQHGYLFLTAQERVAETMRRGVALQQRLGVPSRWLSPDDVRAVFPAVRTDDLVGGTFCPLDGSANPYGAVQGYLRRCRDLGVRVRPDEEVTAIDVRAGRVAGVRTARGACAGPVVVNAAGPRARDVAAMVGVDLPVAPYRRQVFVMTPLPELGSGRPLTVDLDTGWYLHQDRAGALYTGGTDKDSRPGFDEVVDWDGFDTVAQAALARVPAMVGARVVRGYAGIRSLTPDHHAILGLVPAPEGFYLANGFSGHGFMHAPAVGRLLAEIILDGGARSLDVTPLSLARFAQGTRHESVSF
ncbi:MAG TPA: FAD-dependent oxidoreductase [bacterium]|nr:FAD-dependent oxidoreductase [bacterium]